MSDTLNKQTEKTHTSSTTSKFGTDFVDNANASDLLLESERCIAKKAYLTTDKESSDHKKSIDATMSSIDSQILSNKSLFETKKIGTTTKDAAAERYPIATVPSRSTNVDGGARDSTFASSSLVKAKDNDLNRHTTEQYSENYSLSSRMEKATTSNQIIEIIDGMEKIIADTFKESGSIQSKTSQEQYQAKFGSDAADAQVQYDHKLAEENVNFSTDKRDKEPIYDRDYRDTHRHIEQSGDNAPVEHVRGKYETTRFDEKSKKYITDQHITDNNRQLESSTSRISDTMHTKYDIGTARLNVDSTNKVPLSSHTATTAHTSDNTTKFDSNRNSDRLFNTSTTTTFMDTANATKNDSFDSKTSTTYATKAFDSTKTNAWTSVDKSNVETNKHTTTHKSTVNATDESINSKNVIDAKQKIDKNVISDTKLSSTSSSSNDLHRKTARENRTSTDKTNRTNATSITKTSDEKVSQHLYDEKTKTWREVDEKTIKSKRPSLIRYVSKDNDGKYTTIYKRKLFDKRSGMWKVVDEKVYRNNNFNEHIPDVIEDITNITTTTYTTKVFDTKSNTWRVVDEQTFTDRNLTVPKDIADELARDQPDIANITTTTELTKVRTFIELSFYFGW